MEAGWLTCPVHASGPARSSAQLFFYCPSEALANHGGDFLPGCGSQVPQGSKASQELVSALPSNSGDIFEPGPESRLLAQLSMVADRKSMSFVPNALKIERFR